jgi:hypothetical protein
MNERIRELAVQARQYAWANETHWSANAERERLFEQKFAELIVQECVNVLHDNELWNRHISHALKEHFGVEE